MRRELKELDQFACRQSLDGLVTRHIPMRRELKDYHIPEHLKSLAWVTRHIPMRRELKEDELFMAGRQNHRHKAYPDEKGTESLLR